MLVGLQMSLSEGHLLTLYMLNFQRVQNKCFNFFVIPPHWYDLGSWNPSSCETRTYLICIANIMGADVLATQQPYLICWTELIRSPHVKGFD